MVFLVIYFGLWLSCVPQLKSSSVGHHNRILIVNQNLAHIILSFTLLSTLVKLAVTFKRIMLTDAERIDLPKYFYLVVKSERTPSRNV